MNKKLFILIFASVFLLGIISSTSSDLVFKQNEVVNYSFVCLDNNNNYCGTSANCGITINYPNGTNFVTNDSMTSTPTSVNYILDTSQIGIYNWLIVCSGSSNAISEGDYQVTSTGDALGINQSFTLFGLGIMIALFSIVGFSFKQKWKLRLFFFMAAILMGILLLNSLRIIASQSTNLGKMMEIALIFGIIILLFMFLYLFIYALVETFNYFKRRDRNKWSINSNP